MKLMIAEVINDQEILIVGGLDNNDNAIEEAYVFDTDLKTFKAMDVNYPFAFYARDGNK